MSAALRSHARASVRLLLCWLLLSSSRQQPSNLCTMNGIFANATAATPPSTDIQTVSANDCNKSDLRTCCQNENLLRVKACYSTIMKEFVSRARNTLREMDNQKLIASDKKKAFEQLTSGSNAQLRRRRRLQTVVDVTKSVSFMNSFSNVFEYTDTLYQELVKQSNKCWSYYLNKLQRGLSCSVCSTNELNGFFSLAADNTMKPKFVLKVCDLLIPNCIQNIDLQINLSEYYRNVLLLLMNKKFTTNEDLRLVDRFQKAFPRMDSNNYLEDCKKRASCDNLCTQVLKFGSFDNPYIFGNRRLYEAAISLFRGKTAPYKLEFENKALFDILELPSTDTKSSPLSSDTQKLLEKVAFLRQADTKFSLCLKDMNYSLDNISQDKITSSDQIKDYPSAVDCENSKIFASSTQTTTLGALLSCMNKFSGAFENKGIDLMNVSASTMLELFTSSRSSAYSLLLALLSMVGLLA